MTVIVSATASYELEQAAQHYHQIHPTLSKRLLDEFEYVVDLLNDHPRIYRETSIEDVHIASFHSFPYELYYRCSATRVEVVHILPARMDPEKKYEILDR